MSGRLFVLDSLFDDLAIETAAAASAGWEVVRWDATQAALQSAEAVLHVTTRIDRAMFDAMPAVRVVGRFGTGLDSVDRALAAERQVSVVGVRDYCVPELTTHSLGLAFALDRRLSGFGSGANLSWQDLAANMPIPGRIRAVVVGFGTIGRAVASALTVLGITVVVVTDRGAAAARRLGLAVLSLSEALADAGFIFLHAALTAETKGMIGAAELARMPASAILVNTARLGLVDEAALAAALSGGRIAGLGLDARLGDASPLRPLIGDPRFLLTPHIGWYSARSAGELRERAVLETIAEAERLRSSAPPRNARSSK